MSVDEKILRVLIVDDDELIRLMLTALLGHLGAEITGEAANGKEAISAYSAQRPDLTLLDIERPVKNGIDTLKEIRKIDSSAEIIMLTANDNTAVAESCIHAGARTYINKREAPDVIAAVLKTHLDALSIR